MRARISTIGLLAVLATLSLPALPQPASAVPGDFPTDVVGYVEPNGRWHIGGEDFWFGLPGDLPLFGDWDCDGMDSPAVFRPSTGQFLLTNQNATGFAVRSFSFGLPGDIPLVHDWNDDECDTLALYRPSEQAVYVRRTLNSATADQRIDVSQWAAGSPFALPLFARSGEGGAKDVLFFDNGRIVWNISDFSSFWFYGQSGDLIVVGDWNGSGIDGIGVVRPSDGKAYLKNWIPIYPDTAWVATADIVVELGGSGVPIAGSLTPVLPGWMVVGEREILVPSTGDGQADGLALHRAAGFVEFQDRTADTPWTIRLEAGGYSTALACRRGEAFPEYIVIVGAGADKTAIGPCRDQSLRLKNSTLRGVTVNAPLDTEGETVLDQVVSQTFGVGIGEGVTTITDSTIGHSIDVRSTSNTTIWNSTIDAGAGSALLVGPGPVLVVDSILRGATAAVEVQPDVVGDVTLIDTLIDGPLIGEVITCLDVHQELCPA